MGGRNTVRPPEGRTRVSRGTSTAPVHDTTASSQLAAALAERADVGGVVAWRGFGEGLMVVCVASPTCAAAARGATSRRDFAWQTPFRAHARRRAPYP